MSEHEPRAQEQIPNTPEELAHEAFLRRESDGLRRAFRPSRRIWRAGSGWENRDVSHFSPR